MLLSLVCYIVFVLNLFILIIFELNIMNLIILENLAIFFFFCAVYLMSLLYFRFSPQTSSAVTSQIWHHRLLTRIDTVVIRVVMCPPHWRLINTTLLIRWKGREDPEQRDPCSRLRPSGDSFHRLGLPPHGLLVERWTLMWNPVA